MQPVSRLRSPESMEAQFAELDRRAAEQNEAPKHRPAGKPERSPRKKAKKAATVSRLRPGEKLVGGPFLRLAANAVETGGDTADSD